MTKALLILVITALASPRAQAQLPTQAAPACTADALDVSGSAWAERRLSVGTFRVAVDPDTSRGPTTAVTLEAGRLREQANPTNEPYLLVEIGDRKRSCSVRASFAQCPAARQVVAELQRASLPIGLGLAEPAGKLLVLHGSDYRLESVDGFGNRHRLKFTEAGHPFEKLIERAIHMLKPCVQPAVDAYHGR